MAVAMAERLVSAEFVFDRAGEQALAHAYRALVPERRARTVQGKDSDDSTQMATVTESRLEAVNDHDRGQERSALGA
jgi:hypothetical protein